MDLDNGAMRAQSEDECLVSTLKQEITKNFSQQNNPADYNKMMETLNDIRSRLFIKDGHDHHKLRGVQEAMCKLDIHSFTPEKIAAHLHQEMNCNPWHDL